MIPARPCAPAAERMRLSRLRRRDGMRCVPFEVRDSEIAALVQYGLLNPAERDNRQAIAAALGNLLERIPRSWWSVAAGR